MLLLYSSNLLQNRHYTSNIGRNSMFFKIISVGPGKAIGGEWSSRVTSPLARTILNIPRGQGGDKKCD